MTADQPAGGAQPVEGLLQWSAVRSQVSARVGTRVEGTRSRGEGLPYRLEPRWQCLPQPIGRLHPSPTATLSVGTQGTTAGIAPDDRCLSTSVRAGTSCQVDTAPTSFDFKAGAVPQRPAAMLFTVAADGAQADPDPSNNRIRVELDG